MDANSRLRGKLRFNQQPLLPITSDRGKSGGPPSVRTLLIRAGVLISVLSLLLYVGYIQSQVDRQGEANVAISQEQERQQFQQQVENSRIHSIYNIKVLDIDGVEHSMKEFKGKVLLIVNVASECGYTDSNYKGLQQLYDKYKKQGLEILAFPCNQFGLQEPGDNRSVKQFVHDKYGITFKMFSKVNVNGEGAHPLYKFLKRHAPKSQGGGGNVDDGNELEWNFQKFIVDRYGQVRYLIHANYDKQKIEEMVDKILLEQDKES